MDFDSIWMPQKWAVLDSRIAIINFLQTLLNQPLTQYMQR